MKNKIKIVLDSISDAGLTSPKIITLMITNHCNLSCHHCLTESNFNKTTTPISVNAINKLIEEFALLGVQEICLTGGEPLTHPEWFEILSFACNQHNLKRIHLQTNGTLLTQPAIDALCSINSKRLVVQVSLEGSTAKTNDRVRGAGSFEKIIRGLKLLAEAGMGQQVVVAFTEMQHNFAELPNLLHFLYELGIRRIVSGTLVIGGRAALSDQIAPPTPFQYSELLKLYHSDPQFKERYNKIGNFSALEWFSGKLYPTSLCCSCIEKPYIDADGKMYPCLMLPIENLAVKNVYQRPLDDVLLEGLLVWAKLPLLHYQRSVELQVCKNCPGKQHCAGGCMGRAYTSTMNFMSVEDRCVLRKEVYSWEFATRVMKIDP